MGGFGRGHQKRAPHIPVRPLRQDPGNQDRPKRMADQGRAGVVWEGRDGFAPPGLGTGFYGTVKRTWRAAGSLSSHQFCQWPSREPSSPGTIRGVAIGHLIRSGCGGGGRWSRGAIARGRNGRRAAEGGIFDLLSESLAKCDFIFQRWCRGVICGGLGATRQGVDKGALARRRVAAGLEAAGAALPTESADGSPGPCPADCKGGHCRLGPGV